MPHADRTVAVVGAGPAGLVSARFLRGEGFAPVVIDAGARVGGQWDGESAASGIWRGMHANTSRIMTRFSDLDYPEGTPAFPHHAQVRAYLEAYAHRFAPTVRLGTRVVRIARDGAGYVLDTTDAAGRRASERFARIVVASGRYNAANVPAVDGLGTFSGPGGVVHALHYKTFGAVRGSRVLVAGGSISALEIASDLVQRGAAPVAVAMRRQRYVVPRLICGVPADNVGFTRCGALAAESFPPQAVAAALKAFLVAAGGDPSAFGAAAPAADVAEAGIALSQDYVPLLAEGRIVPKPWIARVDGRRVGFADGSAADFDTIVMATGCSLSLPLLDPEIRRVLDVDERHIDLADFTFHPDLAGLAFIGLYPLIGPYFPVLELQARLIAYAWSGATHASREELREKVAAYRRRRGGRQSQLMHAMAILLARRAGVEPAPADAPPIARALLFGPLTATSFRVHGRDALPDAAAALAADAARFGAVRDPAFTPAERAQLAALAEARREPALAALVAVD